MSSHAQDVAARAVGLSKTYGNGETAVNALREVDLDIVAGEFNLRDSFISIKNNEVGFLFGTTGLGRVMIDGNQIEFPTSTSAQVFDFDSGSGTNTNEYAAS